MTNRNDNRERRNKYPNNQKQETEFSKETNIRSEITKRDLHINVNSNMYTFACLRMYKITRFLSLNDPLIDKNLQR